LCNGTGVQRALIGEKSISVPQIPHDLEGDGTRTSEVTGRRLTA
jgi:hypothetical protein